MSYSLYPIPPLDTIHDHHGLAAAIGGIALVLMVWSICCVLADAYRTFYFGLCAAVGTIIFAIIVSFTSGSITDAPNEKVESQFIQYVIETNNTGKHGRYTTTKTYGEFLTPDGKVLLQIPEGTPIKDTQILYKN